MRTLLAIYGTSNIHFLSFYVPRKSTILVISCSGLWGQKSPKRCSFWGHKMPKWLTDPLWYIIMYIWTMSCKVFFNQKRNVIRRCLIHFSSYLYIQSRYFEFKHNMINHMVHSIYNCFCFLIKIMYVTVTNVSLIGLFNKCRYNKSTLKYTIYQIEKNST